jgi:hypothetical protein
LRQPFTQVAVTTLQSGALVGQASVLVAEHWPQRPSSALPGSWQAGAELLVQSPSLPQGSQRWVVVLQTGVAPEQSAEVWQPTQNWLERSQKAVGGVQSWLLVQVGRQTPTGSSQTWLAGHSPSPWQPRHRPVPVSQTGASAGQRVVLVDEHWPHWPLAWQAGAAGSVQSLSEVQPPGGTHWPSERLQTVPPVQRPVLVCEHWPQVPPGWQAGLAVSVQSVSPRQPMQVPAAVSQMGVLPVHRPELPLEHWPQLPLVWQAGAAGSVQSVSPVQPRH